VDPAVLHARPGGAGKKLAEAARLWARGELSGEEQAQDDHFDDALAAFGLELEGAVPRERGPVFYLWPEHVPAWNFFCACRTQWRHGFEGPTGLDYAGVECLMDQFSLPRRRRLKLWPLVRAAESGYLQGLSERREAEREKQGGKP